MAKFWCMFALAGLAAARTVPLGVRVPLAVDQNNLIPSILTNLQPAIDAAISRALAETTKTTVFVQESLTPAVSYEEVSIGALQGGRTVQTAGVGGVVYHEQSAGSQFNSASAANNAAYNGAFNVKAGASTLNEEGLVQGVMSTLAPQINAAVMAALANLNQQSFVSTTSVESGQQSTGVSNQISEISSVQQTISSASLSEEQELIAKIIKALTPGIRAAVKRALAARVETTQIETTVQTAPVVSQTVSVSNAEQGTSSVSFQASSSEKSKLIAQIIAALTPSIELSVSNALQGNKVSGSQTISQSSSQQGFTSSNQQSVGSSNFQTSTVDKSALIAQVMTALRPAISLAVQNALKANTVTTTQTFSQGSNQQDAAFATSNQQSSFGSSSSQASSLDTSALIAQIIAALKPQIALSVQSALQTTSQTSTVSQNNQGFGSFNAGGSSSSTSGFSSSSSSGSSSSGSSSSGALSSGSLTSIFGDGSVHNVKVETPQYTIEYNN